MNTDKNSITSNSTCKFDKQGFALLGAAFEVHNFLGGGLSEEIYHQSLEVELKNRAIPFHSKPRIPVYYKRTRLDKLYFPDFVVYGSLIVELKAATALCREYHAQILNYMRVAKSQVGYLINFGPIGKLEYKRFVL